MAHEKMPLESYQFMYLRWVKEIKKKVNKGKLKIKIKKKNKLKKKDLNLFHILSYFFLFQLKVEIELDIVVAFSHPQSATSRTQCLHNLTNFAIEICRLCSRI